MIEGCDRTGKSSLCERLMDEHGGEVLHFSAPKKNAIEEYVAPLTGYDPGTGQNLYLDRHYLGEAVWPSVFGRSSRMTRIERECVEAVLEHLGALCVLAVRDPLELETACANEPCAGRAVLAQRAFARETQRSILTWATYVHGDDLDMLVRAASQLESDAADRISYVRPV